MALQSSGSISILEIAAEFGFQSGQSSFRNLSDYYAGAGLVASSLTDTSGNALPSSGAIKLSDFYTLTKFLQGHLQLLRATARQRCQLVLMQYTYSLPLVVVAVVVVALTMIVLVLSLLEQVVGQVLLYQI